MKRINMGCRFNIVVLQVIAILGTLIGGSVCVHAVATKTHAPALVVKRVKIKIVNAPENEKIYLQMAKRLIRLKSGDLLTASKIKACVDALSLSNRFAAINVDTADSADGEIVTFLLTPYRFIRKIAISGSYPLFEKEILNRMTIFPGEVFRPEELPKQSGFIADLYRKEGYVDPRVNISAKNSADSGNVTIEVQIKKGAHYTPGKLTFKGNQAIGVTRLKPRMKSWRVGLLMGAVRFTEDRLKKDIEKLRNYYRSKGYAEVDITYKLDTKRHFPKVDVTLSISEGPRYKIDFEGNKQFWEYTLKKDVVLFFQGNRSGLGVRRSLQNIRRRYLQKGYLNATVVAQSEEASTLFPGLKRIDFVITEGVRTKVSQVTLNGHQQVLEEDIGKQILTRPPGWFHSGAFVQETLDEDIFAINTLYLNKGFQDVKVEYQTTLTPDRGSVAVEIKIQEGSLTRVGEVSIAGPDFVDLQEIKKKISIQTGQPFRANLLKNDEGYLSGLISEKGYPYVVVTSKAVLSSGRTVADVKYNIDPSQKVGMGQIFVSGNLRTREKVVLRELEITPEEPLSLQKLIDGQRALRNLAIFQSVQFQPIGLKEKEDTVNLFVEVQEKKPYYTEFGVGYDSEDGFGGRVKLGDSNFFGLNKNIWGSAEFSETGYRVESGITEPRLLGSKISADFTIYNERTQEPNQTFGTDTVGGSLGFGRKWTDALSTSLSFALKQIDPFGEVQSDTIDNLGTVLETTPAIRYDSRDSFIKPTRGWVSAFSVNISKRIEDIEKFSDDFLKYNLDLRYYYTLIEKITLAWMGRIGHIQPYGGSTEIPDHQLLYLGGTNDVRGFDKNLLRCDANGNSIGGRTSLAGSFEIRLDIGWNLELTTFFDSGSVQDSINDAGSDEFRSSAGLGLRYITAIGPIGLLYGHKLEVKEGESPGRWHFSIGYTF